jgi:hemerythrin-like domain-containing protein
MIEHRLIERMLSVIENMLSEIESKQQVDPVSVEVVVDFIKVYADRTHHGKEEDILFREMDKKPLSAEDRKIMNELIDEHVIGRNATKALADANMRYQNGEKAALEEIADNFKTLLEMYPQHIDKEDNNFFPASRTISRRKKTRRCWKNSGNLIES